MAIAIVFTPASMDAAKYSECISRLERAHAGRPVGRLYHACYGAGSQLRVFDVWDSKASFEAFGKILMPILRELGIDPGQPEVSEVHNIIAS